MFIVKLWKLFWWWFKKYWLVVVLLVFLIFVYIMVIFVEFVVFYGLILIEWLNIFVLFCVVWIWYEGELYWLFIYELECVCDFVMVCVIYEEDKILFLLIKFFVCGEEYKFWG